MEALREIIELVTYKPKKGASLVLYNLLSDKQINRDGAIEHFASPSHFRTAYARLKKKCLEELLLHDFADSDTYVRRWADIIKLHTQYKFLLKQQKVKAAIEIGMTLQKKAKQYDLLDILFDFSTDMINYYTGPQLSLRNLKRYKAAAYECHQALGEELQALDLYSNIVTSEKLIADHRDKIKDLSVVAERNSHFRFRLYYYSAQRIYRRKKEDREGLMNICEEAINFFDNCPHVIPNMAYFVFFYDVIPLLIQRKYYQKAERRIKHCLKMPQEGSYNYHIILLLQAILGISSRKPGITKNALRAAGKEWLFENQAMVQAWQMVRDEFEKNEGPKSGEKLLKALYK